MGSRKVNDNVAAPHASSDSWSFEVKLRLGVAAHASHLQKTSSGTREVVATRGSASTSRCDITALQRSQRAGSDCSEAAVVGTSFNGYAYHIGECQCLLFTRALIVHLESRS